jgi:hypothetical protein
LVTAQSKYTVKHEESLGILLFELFGLPEIIENLAKFTEVTYLLLMVPFIFSWQKKLAARKYVNSKLFGGQNMLEMGFSNLSVLNRT